MWISTSGSGLVTRAFFQRLTSSVSPSVSLLVRLRVSCSLGCLIHTRFMCLFTNEKANQATGANAGGPRQLPMRARWTAPSLSSIVTASFMKKLLSVPILFLFIALVSAFEPLVKPLLPLPEGNYQQIFNAFHSREK